MNRFQIITFVILTSFVLSVPLAAIGANAAPDNPWTNTYKTPGVIMKFCQNAATTMQDCDETYEGYTWTDRIYVLIIFEY